VSKEDKGIECVASHEKNIKFAEISLEKLKNVEALQFECQVIGTGPKFDDFYRIEISLIDTLGNTTLLHDSDI
jgi:hypothetical protein